MIISHKLRCIFVAVPKTGTHAIRFALRPHLGQSDEEQVGLFVRKRSSYPELAGKKHGHLTAREIREAVGDDVWRSYFKFGVVRNPWDRVVSNFFFFYRRNPELLARAQAAIPQMLSTPSERDRLLMQPQHRFLCDSDDRLLVDFVARFESLDSDFTQICAKIGISTGTLERVNASTHEPWQTYFDEGSARLVQECYAKDIDLFDYAFDLAPAPTATVERVTEESVLSTELFRTKDYLA